MDKLSKELEGGHALGTAHAAAPLHRALEQRLAPWEPLPPTTKSLVCVRRYRDSLVLCVWAEGIKTALQKENSVFGLHGVLRWGKSPTLRGNCACSKPNTCTPAVSECRSNYSPCGLGSLTCFTWHAQAKRSDLRRGRSAACCHGGGKGSRLLGRGMERGLCSVFSGSFREHLCGAARLFAQPCNWWVKQAPLAIVHSPQSWGSQDNG